MLKMDQVTKVYRTDTVETHALRDLSFSIDEGEGLWERFLCLHPAEKGYIEVYV